MPHRDYQNILSMGFPLRNVLNLKRSRTFCLHYITLQIQLPLKNWVARRSRRSCSSTFFCVLTRWAALRFRRCLRLTVPVKKHWDDKHKNSTNFKQHGDDTILWTQTMCNQHQVEIESNRYLLVSVLSWLARFWPRPSWKWNDYCSHWFRYG